jgi:type VI secretion system protein ImpG
MRDELLSYYERELAYLRQLGADFAQKYPKVASRLLLEPNRCEDPHVERLLEGFAFLAARLHLKLNDEFPEFTQALLNILYPHFVRPLPSMTVAQFETDVEHGQVTTGIPVPRGSMLTTHPVGGFPCQFRTCYEQTVWPVEVASATFTSPERLDNPIKAPDAPLALRMVLRTGHNVEWARLNLDRLHFYLHGESSVVFPLYEVLLNNTLRIVVRDTAARSRVRPLTLAAGELRPMGFEESESMLPYPRRSFTGYRLLQEYFSFPEKFLFIELGGLECLRGMGVAREVEIVFLLSRPERSDWEQLLALGVSAKTLRLGCTPVVNLFELTADPILLAPERYEYPVVADARRRTSLEVFSIESITATKPSTGDAVTFEPFYSYRHATSAAERPIFWHATRRASEMAFDDSTDVWLTLVDIAGKPSLPKYDTLTPRCLCSNRDLPAKLSYGAEAGDFKMEGGLAIHRITALRKPTMPVRPPLESGMLWRLISHLSLNYLSLVEEGREALQEILRLYTPGAGLNIERQIEGISRVSGKRHFTRVVSEHGISFVRGTRVELELEEESFVGAGAYLFSSVLDRFLGLYVSLNSFSQLVVRSTQRKEPLKSWPARAGRGVLL